MCQIYDWRAAIVYNVRMTETADKIGMKKNTLYYGDCLEVMRNWNDGCVDLIYLDPPFNSKANYNILFGTETGGNNGDDLAQLTAFTDTWEWDLAAQQRVDAITRAVAHPAHRAIRAFSEIYPDGSGMLSYLSYMAQRIGAMHRLLKDTGSIYLHCDPTASHYLKIMMDEIFGKKNFRNEIIWCYTGPSASKKNFPAKHDSILRYSKGDDWVFNADAIRMPYKDLSIQHSDPEVTTGIGGKLTKANVQEYIDKGKIPESWWPEFSPVGRIKSERLGYPTQKPLALLKRIVTASSNEGDLVLDPFCGCGTTIEAAHGLKRDWIGIDISAYAIEVVRRERMKDLKIDLAGVPKDLKGARDFAARNPFDFEKWAVTRIPGFAPNTIQRSDGGIDGRAIIFGADKGDALCIAQVKGGAPHIDALKAFAGIIHGGKAAIGVFITLDKWDTPTVRKCVAQAGTLQFGVKTYNRLVMYTIDDYFRGIDAPIPPLAHPRTGEAFQVALTSQ